MYEIKMTLNSMNEGRKIAQDLITFNFSTSVHVYRTESFYRWQNEEFFGKDEAVMEVLMDDNLAKVNELIEFVKAKNTYHVVDITWRQVSASEETEQWSRVKGYNRTNG